MGKNFLTGYYHKGELVVEKKKIIKNYMSF